MSAVLKSGAASRLGIMKKPTEPVADPRLTALADELAEARAALAAMRKAGAAAAEQAKLDRQEALAAARENGRRAAQDHADERLATLRAAVTNASAAWQARLDELEPLAVTLARTALAKLFAENELAGYVGDTIARHLAALREAGATAFHVHPDLATDLSDTGLTIVPDASLPRDGCRVSLTLGTADLSVERQWQAIDALLASLEAPR